MPRPNPMLVPGKRNRPQIVVDKTGLTARQATFIREYISNGENGAQAAIAAGYSPASARSIASENLTKPNIVKEKNRIMSQIADEAGLTKAYIMKRMKDCTALDESKNGATVLKALELAGKHQGLFSDKTEVTVKSHEDWLEDIKDG